MKPHRVTSIGFEGPDILHRVLMLANLMDVRVWRLSDKLWRFAPDGKARAYIDTEQPEGVQYRHLDLLLRS